MIDVKFRVFPGTGDARPPWEHAPLNEFLLTTPVFVYELQAFGVVPPIHVLNEILANGYYDAGMGGACEWEPFQLSSDEYSELVFELTTTSNYSINEDKDLEGKPNFKEWHRALLSKHSKSIRGSR